MPFSANPEAGARPARRHYANPPIREALVDIRCAFEVDPDRAAVEEFCKSIAGFPKLQLMTAGKAQIQMSPDDLEGIHGPVVTAEHQFRGFRLDSAGETDVAQVRTDGFTFSRLEPYTSWEAMSLQARDIWTAFRSQFKPDSITRLAVRYINQLQLPIGFRDFSDYLRTYPTISPDANQTLGALFMRLVIPYPDQSCLVNATLASTAQSRPDSIPLVLDLDVVWDAEVPQDDDSIWDTLQQIHDCENQVFESFITDAMREEFD